VSATESTRRGPRVILIGGPMTVDGGTKLDSRKRSTATPALRRRAGRWPASHLWWKTVESLVMPILESAGPDAFALVVGKRSITEMLSDGSTRRTLLRKFCPVG